MRNWIFYGCLMLALTAWTGCFGGSGSDSESDAGSETTTMNESDSDADAEEPTSISGALAQAQQAMEQAQQAMGNGESVEPVDFRELRAMLPESLPGMERTNAEGQKTSTMGIKVSQAEAEYRGDDGSVEISIIDMGTMKSVAMFGYAWLMAEMDKESDRGFERTTKYRGYPAYEKCEQSGDRMNCTFQVVVGERYIASVEGRGVTRSQMDDIRDEIPVRKLDGMRDAGVSSE